MKVRLYDTRAQRRPVYSHEFGEHPFTALAVTEGGRWVGGYGGVWVSLEGFLWLSLRVEGGWVGIGCVGEFGGLLWLSGVWVGIGCVGDSSGCH
jgi:hypothetical protein